MKKTETAREFIETLNRDPKYQAMRAEKEKRLAALKAMLDADAKPLIEALAAAGRQVKSVWDLVNTAESYPEAIPVLVEHLQRPYNIRTREGIARALSVKEARGPVAHIVLGELKKMNEAKDPIEESYRFALTNALVTIGDSSMQEDIRQMLNDPNYAKAHMGLERAFKAISRRKSQKEKK
jgi:hypothetical protein